MPHSRNTVRIFTFQRLTQAIRIQPCFRHKTLQDRFGSIGVIAGKGGESLKG